MDRRKRVAAQTVWIAAATVVVVVAFILSLRAFGGSSPYAGLFANGATSVDIPITLNQVEIHTRSAGQPVWQVRAASFVVAPDRLTGDAQTMSNGVFYMGSKPVLRFSAGALTYDQRLFASTADITLRSGVRVTTVATVPVIHAPVILSSSQVVWQTKSHMVVCPAPVHASVGNFGTGQAATITLDIDRQSLDMTGVQLAANIGALPPLQPDSTPVSGQPAAEGSGTVHMSAGQGGHYDESTRILTLRGPVVFTQGAEQMKTNGAVYDRNSNTVTSDTPVTLTDPEAVVTGNHGSVDFSTHIASLSGNIQMVIQPRPGDPRVKEPEEKEPTTVKCDQINYDYQTKKATTTGAVVIRQTNRTVTANLGTYDGTTKLIDLVGNVIEKSTDGRTLNAPHASISTDTTQQFIDVDGPITGDFPAPADETPPPAKKKGSHEKPGKPGAATAPAASAPSVPNAPQPATPAPSTAPPPPTTAPAAP